MYKTIILASGSPRRTELLSKARVPHRILVSDVDETPIEGEDPSKMVARLARLKAEAVGLGLSK